MISTEFLITSLVVVLIPGTGVIYTISIGLFHGWRASVFAALGCTIGIVPHLLASNLGLAAILHVSGLAFQVVKFLGVAYLLYLAWSMWKETGPMRLENNNVHPLGAAGIVIRGVLINILNPKLSLFFLAFLPQFVSMGSDTALQDMLVLSGIFMAMTLLIFVLYGLTAHGVRVHVAGSASVMRVAQRAFAVIFAALATKLALSDR